MYLNATLFLVVLAGCGSAEPEAAAAPDVDALEDAPPVEVVPAEPADGAVAGQAQLLAACLGLHDTTGTVRLGLTLADGRVKAAEIADRGEASQAFADCLAEKAVGMPYAAAGKAELTLTAM